MRNYRSLLALVCSEIEVGLSTIVEIIEAYQPFDNSGTKYWTSTIVEIIEAYQPNAGDHSHFFKSTIVEIIEAYQPADSWRQVAHIYNSRNYRSLLAKGSVPQTIIIYNSRNYRSLLALVLGLHTYIVSTIVEIIEAYQPRKKAGLYYRNLQQQKLQKLTSLIKDLRIISESTIVEIIEAYQPAIGAREGRRIYNSRNYRSLLA